MFIFEITKQQHKMLTAIIIDDESKGRITLVSLLNKYCKNIEIIAQASNVPEAINAITQHKPNIVFLDIQLQDGTGFDILNGIENIQSKVIFTTAFDEYAVKAFRFSAIDYLLKPIDPEQLISAVNKAATLKTSADEQQFEALVQNLNNNTDKKIVINSHQGQFIIKVADIVRCESDSNYTTIYNTNGTKILVTKSLREYEELLSEHQFFRVHKSHLINTKYVSKYDLPNSIIILNDDTIIEIARRRKDALIQFIKN